MFPKFFVEDQHVLNSVRNIKNGSASPMDSSGIAFGLGRKSGLAEVHGKLQPASW